MINLSAKQVGDLAISRLDNATLLSLAVIISGHVTNSDAVRQKLGTIATAVVTAAQAYDEAYNPSAKDLLTDVLKALDEARDKSQGSWHESILASLRSPNEQKAAVARQLVQLYKDYRLDTADEYMKQTTNIGQMLQVIEGNASIMSLLPSMGLDDYLSDLKAKNEAFAAKMAERTAGTVGREKGVVAAARQAMEARIRDLVTAVNVVSIYEGDGSLDAFIDQLNAEYEHYRQILARKGYSSASGSTGGTSSSTDGSSDSDSSGSGSSDSGSGSSDSGSGSGSSDSGSGSSDSDSSGSGSSDSGSGSGSSDSGGSGSGSGYGE